MYNTPENSRLNEYLGNLEAVENAIVAGWNSFNKLSTKDQIDEIAEIVGIDAVAEALDNHYSVDLFYFQGALDEKAVQADFDGMIDLIIKVIGVEDAAGYLIDFFSMDIEDNFLTERK